jgi:hypothetical protein
MDFRVVGDTMVFTWTMTSDPQFADAVAHAFSFLEDSGYRRVEQGATRIRYETDRVFVAIDWDPRSGELNAFLGLQPTKGEQPDGFSLTDLLRMENVDVPERNMPFQVADETQLGPFLTRLAEDIRAHAQAALAGDRMFFHRLKAFRSAQSQVYMRDMKLRRVRSEVEEAWRGRDFRRVRELYSSIKGDLTEAEKGKLEYATKHAIS